MKRILVLGLMASTLLTAVPATAQREGGREDRGRGGGRGEAGWVNSPRPNQPANTAREGGGDRGRSPSAREDRAPRAVNNVAVPASSAQPQWNRQRDNSSPAPRPDATADRGNWRGNRDRGPGAAPSAQPQAAQQAPATRPGWNRDGNDNRQRDWNRSDTARRDSDARGDNRGRPGWSNDDRRDNDRNRDGNRDSARNNDRDRNWRDNDRTRDWSRNDNRGNDRTWNYQRRLNDRDRWSDYRRWDNNGWRSDRRYDWQRYRTQNRYIYRLPTYYAPYGWNYGYRRFSIGIYLSNVLFGSSYWIDDPYEYRLPPAYGPLRWVRYYDDALLVDIRDGYVVDVIHGFFW
jgi:hypothetical protein